MRPPFFIIFRCDLKNALFLRRYAKCNTPLFSPNGAISAFFGVTETVEILLSSINFLDKDLNTNAYLVIIQGVPKKVLRFDPQ